MVLPSIAGYRRSKRERERERERESRYQCPALAVKQHLILDHPGAVTARKNNVKVPAPRNATQNIRPKSGTNCIFSPQSPEYTLLIPVAGL